MFAIVKEGGHSQEEGRRTSVHASIPGWDIVEEIVGIVGNSGNSGNSGK